MSSAHRLAIVLTPVVAVATLAIGLRVGGRRTVHAAVVYGAPRAHGATALAWQVVTFVEDGGQREAEARSGITVRARAGAGANAREATWTGDTNDDGVAEARLDLPDVRRGDPVDLEVRAAGATEPLAKGLVAWDGAAWMNAAPGPFVRPSKREGPIALDVAILGGKLLARSEVSLLVRATSREDGRPLPGVTIAGEPEPGVEVRQPSATTCSLGWARLDVSSRIYVAALSLHAVSPDGRKGDWFSDLPVATGSIRAQIADVVKGDDPRFTVQASSPVYVEIDDDEGRAFATWARLPGPAGEAVPLSSPPLTPGLRWLVTSSEPRGAEVLDEGAIARPFLVEGRPGSAGALPSDDPCAVEGYLALHPAGGFRRWTALDGFVARKDSNGARRRRGRAIGLGSLAVASVLELLLLIEAARRGRRLSSGATSGIDGTASLMKPSGAGSAVIAVLLGLLGFGLLAALLLLHG